MFGHFPTASSCDLCLFVYTLETTKLISVSKLHAINHITSLVGIEIPALLTLRVLQVPKRDLFFFFVFLSCVWDNDHVNLPPGLMECPLFSFL